MPCVLYRAITQREYDDIVELGNRFRIREFTLEAKQFAISEECGHYYGHHIVEQFDRVPYILVRVELLEERFCAETMPLDDCIGVSIDQNEIEAFNASIVSFDVINLN